MARGSGNATSTASVERMNTLKSIEQDAAAGWESTRGVLRIRSADSATVLLLEKEHAAKKSLLPKSSHRVVRAPKRKR